jgi:hypothetical protein
MCWLLITNYLHFAISTHDKHCCLSELFAAEVFLEIIWVEWEGVVGVHKHMWGTI